MSTYTAVDEGFDVEVFTSVKAMAKRFFWAFLDEDCATPVTYPALAKAIRESREVRLFAKDRPYDWCYKLQRH